MYQEMASSQVSILGFNIQKLRKQNQLSQESLAHLAQMKYSNLTKIESGKIRNPNVYTVARIAKALNTSVEELIFSDTDN